jgi:hypothetical protein
MDYFITGIAVAQLANTITQVAQRKGTLTLESVITSCIILVLLIEH